MPYAGRGGAGNIEAAAQATSSKPTDVEANDKHHEPTIDSPSVSAAPLQEYAYTGRGGAGNYYSPPTLTQTGTFSTTVASTKATRPSVSTTIQRRKSSVSSPLTALGSLYFGRGGAGNFRGETASMGAAEDESKPSAEQEIKDQVERDVELGLAKPEHAWLGGRQVDVGLGFNAPDHN